MQPFRRAGVITALVIAVTAVCGGFVHAQDVRIAAVVNDQVISVGDFQARVQLVLASANIPDDADTRARVGTQVMRQMIDEKLEMQEAKKENVTFTEDELKHQLAGLAKINHIPPDGLDKFLADHHIDKDTLISKMTAETLWARVVQRRYGHTVSVGEDEINDAMKLAEAGRQKPENHIAEIFLSVDNPQQDPEVHQLADRLFQEIQKGAQFQAVAHQFSQSPTAATGGDVGWMIPGMLDPEVEKIIDGMQPQTMTQPVRMAGGYYIYLLIERRAPESSGTGVVVDLSQVVFPMAADADAATRAATIKKAKEVTADTHSCGEIAKLGRDTSPDLSGPIGQVQVTELPPELRPTILAAEIAKPTDPVPVRGGIGVFMVCSRKDSQPRLQRAQVENDLKSERLENIARRYLADLRRVAYVDLRV